MLIRRREDLPFGGFGGLLERHYIMDHRTFGDRRSEGALSGLGNCRYLADAGFKPRGGTGMHAHSKVDIISVIVRGELDHRGSLGDGVKLHAGQVQVQRAGAQTFEHNEFNPTEGYTHLIQLWMVPAEHQGDSGYRIVDLKPGHQVVYGGADHPETRIGGVSTQVAVIPADADSEWTFSGRCQCYLASGDAIAVHGDHRETLSRETLVDGGDITIQCLTTSLLIVIQSASGL